MSSERQLDNPDNQWWGEHLHRYLFAISYVSQSSTVLDIACGNGFGTFRLAAKSKYAVGGDISESTIIECKNKYVKNNLSFQIIDGTNIPYDNNYFDCVISFETIEHTIKFEKMLSEFKRVAKSNAIIILSTPNKTISSPIGIISNPFHTQEFDYDELKTILQSIFSQVTIYGQKYIRYCGKRTIRKIIGKKTEQLFYLRGVRKLPLNIQDSVMKFLINKQMYPLAMDYEVVSELEAICKCNTFIAICKCDDNIVSSKLVSVIIPCYNGATYVAETINSVLQQTYKNIEIIVIDDGSTDKTKDIILSIQSPLLKYIHQKNSGVSAARNKGKTIAKGEFILYLDADDILESEFVEKRVQLLEFRADVIFACSDALSIDSSNSEIGSNEPVYKNIAEQILTYAKGHNSCPSNYLIRNNVVTSKISFNEKLSSSADRLFLIELSQKGYGVKIKGKGRLKYRIIENTMSRTISTEKTEDIILFYRIVKSKTLMHKQYWLTFKFKTFRICFSESIKLMSFNLLKKSISHVLLK